ncbi:hypothetical protein ACFV1L_06150 [Kitasatospora sp. NPDC059646]|uniref:hypothetical protein n=1 Tax=Kitasatospora sp. NPDC059646 TaxID=3346893 RepID=UPI0036A55032
MASLPSDADLSELFTLGYRDSEVADMYGVTRQAVNLRWIQRGLFRYPIASQVVQMLGQLWEVKTSSGAGSHMHSHPCQSLRYYLRSKLGDTLSERQALTALRFESRLRRKGEVLAYDPEAGFGYVKREPSDARLVVRWPAEVPRPTGELEALWSIPETAA